MEMNDKVWSLTEDGEGFGAAGYVLKTFRRFQHGIV